MTAPKLTSLTLERTQKVTFSFDGVSVTGFYGESIAAALLRQGIKTIRNAPNSATPRGVFCAMGLCQECVVQINGRRLEACRTPINEGLIVEKITYS